jgi:hypothetical protein
VDRDFWYAVLPERLNDARDSMVLRLLWVALGPDSQRGIQGSVNSVRKIHLPEVPLLLTVFVCKDYRTARDLLISSPWSPHWGVRSKKGISTQIAWPAPGCEV